MGTVASTPEDWSHEQQQQQQATGQASAGENPAAAATVSPLSSLHASMDDGAGTPPRIAVSPFDGDDELQHTPDIRELKEHMNSMRDIQRAKFARGVMIFANVVSFVFAVLLIYYGASNRTKIDLSRPKEAFSAVGDQILELGDFAVDRVENYLQHGYVRNILRPYQLVVALGVALLVLSLLGCLGSLCPSRQVGREMLFGYFSVVLVFVCVLLWGSVMCFQYQNETKRMLQREVDIHWQQIKPFAPGKKKDMMSSIQDNSNLIISGAFCLVSAVTMTIGLWASSKTMGHYFTMKRVMVGCSVSGLFSGMVLISLSIFYGAKGIGGHWAPGVTAVSGVAILLLSLLGMFGAKTESLLALVLHLFLMCCLSLFVSVMGVFVIAYPHVVSELVHRNWRKIAHDYTGMTERHFRNEVADNLLLLGSASILFGVLLIISAAASFAMCLEVYHRKSNIILKKIQIR